MPRYSAILKIDVTEASHDELVDEHKRLLHINNYINRYVSCLRDMRKRLYDDFLTTKSVCLFWRYRQLCDLVRGTLLSYQDVLTAKQQELAVLDRGDFDLLESYVCDLDEVGSDHSRHRLESVSFLNKSEQITKKAKALEQAAKYNDLNRQQLQKDIRNLQEKLTKSQEVFRQECAVFQQLACQYESARKYNALQRYVALKCIIKIASKADL